MPLDVTSTTEEKVHIRLAPKTSSGKPAVVDGIPVWSVTSGNATVVPDADGLGAYVVSEDVIGSSVIQVDADADLGEGVKTISESVNYTYTDAQAAALGITADAAEPK